MKILTSKCCIAVSNVYYFTLLVNRTSYDKLLYLIIACLWLTPFISFLTSFHLCDTNIIYCRISCNTINDGFYYGKSVLNMLKCLTALIPRKYCLWCPTLKNMIFISCWKSENCYYPAFQPESWKKLFPI
jgi:hypothetical protein